MEPIDIDAIIKKYSQPIESSQDSNKFPFYSADYSSFNQQKIFQFRDESEPKMAQSYETKSSYNFNEPKISTYNLSTQFDSTTALESKYANSNLNSIFSSNYHATSKNKQKNLAHRSYLSSKDGKQSGIYDLNSFRDSQIESKSQLPQDQIRYGGYSWENQAKSISQLNSELNIDPFSYSKYLVNQPKGYSQTNLEPISKNNFDKINSFKENQGENFQKSFIKNPNFDQKPLINAPEKEQVNVFSSSNEFKSTTNYPLYDRNKHELTTYDQKPSIEFISGMSMGSSQFNFSKSQSNTNDPFSTKPTTQHFTPSYSTHQLTSFGAGLQQTNQFPQFQAEPEQAKSSNIYKKLEPSLSLKPNSEGFIPLHLTKEQMEYETCDINCVQMQEKKVYDRLQITGKMKTASPDDFTKANNSCGWKNNIIYDISTNDDNRKKGFWGKWC